MLLAYEDVHWIDPTTQELLGLAIERIRRLRLLALITFRPEFAPPWIELPHVSSLTLTRLERRHGVAMVEQLVREKALPDEVAAQIVAKTRRYPALRRGADQDGARVGAAPRRGRSLAVRT